MTILELLDIHNEHAEVTEAFDHQECSLDGIDVERMISYRRAVQAGYFTDELS